MAETTRSLLTVVPIACAVGLTMAAALRHASAESTEAQPSAHTELCATRLYTTMVGEGAPPEALASAHPQDAFDALVTDPRFQERFAGFINAQFNPFPGAKPTEDAAYYTTKYVLTQHKPWSDMFLGHLDVAQKGWFDPEGIVQEKEDGLGYFKSRAWVVRYAGNEPDGVRISAAYRILQNTIGLTLVATTNAPEADISATGRKAPACASCHYEPWFALDKIAMVLGKRVGSGDFMYVDTSAVTPQPLLDGATISNERELVEALVASEAFDVNACRLAFKYLYGRAEHACEGALFDTCVTAFKKDKTITSALAVIAKDPTFCE